LNPFVIIAFSIIKDTLCYVDRKVSITMVQPAAGQRTLPTGINKRTGLLTPTHMMVHLTLLFL